MSRMRPEFLDMLDGLALQSPPSGAEADSPTSASSGGSWSGHPSARSGAPHARPTRAPTLAAPAPSGYVFACSKETRDECFERALFGSPAGDMRAMLRRVQPKVTRLFLYDFSRKQLHGVFVAVAPPEMNIDPSAWGAPGRKSSRFPAQVRVERVPGTNRVGDVRGYAVKMGAVDDREAAQLERWFAGDEAPWESGAAARARPEPVPFGSRATGIAGPSRSSNDGAAGRGRRSGGAAPRERTRLAASLAAAQFPDGPREVTIVPDTNALMDHPMWELLMHRFKPGRRCRATVAVPCQVVKELDGLKNSENADKARRARHANADLLEAIRATQDTTRGRAHAENVMAALIIQSPDAGARMVQSMPAPRPSGDEQIVFFAQERRRQGELVAMVTRDVNASIMARSNGPEDTRVATFTAHDLPRDADSLAAALDAFYERTDDDETPATDTADARNGRRAAADDDTISPQDGTRGSLFRDAGSRHRNAASSRGWWPALEEFRDGLRDGAPPGAAPRGAARETDGGASEEGSVVRKNAPSSSPASGAARPRVRAILRRGERSLDAPSSSANGDANAPTEPPPSRDVLLDGRDIVQEWCKVRIGPGFSRENLLREGGWIQVAGLVQALERFRALGAMTAPGTRGDVAALVPAMWHASGGFFPQFPGVRAISADDWAILDALVDDGAVRLIPDAHGHDDGANLLEYMLMHGFTGTLVTNNEAQFDAALGACSPAALAAARALASPEHVARYRFLPTGLHADVPSFIEDAVPRAWEDAAAFRGMRPGCTASLEAAAVVAGEPAARDSLAESPAVSSSNADVETRADTARREAIVAAEEAAAALRVVEEAEAAEAAAAAAAAPRRDLRPHRDARPLRVATVDDGALCWFESLRASVMSKVEKDLQHSVGAMLETRRIGFRAERLVGDVFNKWLFRTYATGNARREACFRDGGEAEDAGWTHSGPAPARASDGDPMIPSNAPPAMTKYLVAQLVAPPFGGGGGFGMNPEDARAAVDSVVELCSAAVRRLRKVKQSVTFDAWESVEAREFSSHGSSVAGGSWRRRGLTTWLHWTPPRAEVGGAKLHKIEEWIGATLPPARELPILRSHFDELCRAYLANVSSQSAEAEDVALELMLPRVFACVSRYETLSSTKSGHQAAVPEAAMAALKEDFGVRFECFASPLNALCDKYCSLFPDTDRFFGSRGSFFDYFPRDGSHECNPPYDAASVEQTLLHLATILLGGSAEASEARARAMRTHENHAREETTRAARANASGTFRPGDYCVVDAPPPTPREQPLSFVLVIPQFLGRDSPTLHKRGSVHAWTLLDPFVRAEVALEKARHGFRYGLQHRPPEEDRTRRDGREHWVPREFGTRVYWLQNDAGANVWPADAAKIRRFAAAFEAAAEE